ncbi:MAG: GDP-mannose 4,6-dehydratase [Rhodospirillales bacterium]|nr:GDP-mannose 4,6-dehydratase [Alphaproteobacteria bacterium]MCB9977822.1 GDP-mannose 4,6-dehydratase [Rhodospirillales bacterium]
MSGFKKTALITGIAGQDGGYLAEFLIRRGYKVHGLIRWDSYVDPQDGLKRLSSLGLTDASMTLHHGDVTDAQSVAALIKQVRPDEIYNLAALSQVGVSFTTPAATLDINTKGTLAILDAIRLLDMERTVRLYQASSSEMFGSAPAPQDEHTPFMPCSPYGVAKLAAYWLVKTYRDAYGLHASNGILFNHESPARGEDFVTRKITKAVAGIEAGSREVLKLGNLDSIRDWGHARDYVEGMWLMLQQDVPDDYVLATGQAHSVREFVERAFEQIGMHIVWSGQGVEETGRDKRTGRLLVSVDASLFRPKDVHHLLGNARKAQDRLNWLPRYYFDDLVADMVNADRVLLWREAGGDSAWKMTG